MSKNQTFSTEATVWVKHPKKSWVQGKVIGFEPKKGLYTVMDETNEELAGIPEQNLSICRVDLLDEALEQHDMLLLSELSEAGILQSCRVRFARDLVYTNIGAIVVALNPFNYKIPHYMDDQMPKYLNEGDVIRNNIPHSWAVAHNTFFEMINEKRPQTILVSGESGAGKTEACKIVMKYFGQIANMRATEEAKASAEQVRIRILQSSPILEGFGNAKTVRNNNSSRFGKFVKIKFAEEGFLTGAFTINYLLEKSRIVTASKNERVYHALYQVCKGDYKNKLGLDEAKNYKATNAGGCIAIEGEDDAKEFRDNVQAMAILGLDKPRQDELWRVVAGCLSAENIELKAKDADTTVVDPAGVPFMKKACECWGISPEDYERELLTTTNVMRGETVVKKHKVAQALDMRQSVTKHMYERLFKFLIEVCNRATSNNGSGTDDAEDMNWIGLLDIFGFEDFEFNSFEQVCINLANESLQNHYNNFIFKRDLEECRAEGIQVDDFVCPDNTPCLKLVSDSLGVLGFLDEECMAKDDMELLTDTGFVGYEEARRRYDAGTLRVAGYDQNSRCLVYEKPTNFIDKDGAPATGMYEIKERVYRDKNGPGGASSTTPVGYSIKVTGGHQMLMDCSTDLPWGDHTPGVCRFLGLGPVKPTIHQILGETLQPDGKAWPSGMQPVPKPTGSRGRKPMNDTNPCYFTPIAFAGLQNGTRLSDHVPVAELCPAWASAPERVNEQRLAGKQHQDRDDEPTVDRKKIEEALAEVLGFWLGGGGSLDAQSANGCDVMFTQTKDNDVAFLQERFNIMGLELGVDYSEDIQYRPAVIGRKQEVKCVLHRISRHSWRVFFAREYACKYVGGLACADGLGVKEDAVAAWRREYGSAPPTDAEIRARVETDDDVDDETDNNKKLPDGTPSMGLIMDAAEKYNAKKTAATTTIIDFDKSAKWFWRWVWLLCRGHALALLRGLWEADGSDSKQAADLGNLVCTSSLSFRDQITRLAFHAGRTTKYIRKYKVGDERGQKKDGTVIRARHDHWEVLIAPPGERAHHPEFMRKDIRKVEGYSAGVWCVSMPSGNIVARRRHADIAQSYRPVIIGNCMLQTGSDESMLAKITQHCGSNAFFERKPTMKNCFTIKHYAGNVTYTIGNWVEKNRDNLKDDYKTMMRESKNGVAKELLPEPVERTGRPLTVGGFFKTQVKDLMDLINSTNPHWIRCIKAHPAKKPKLFDGLSTTNQLASSGVLGTVKIRKAGYPVRVPYDKFLSRYKILMGRCPPDASIETQKDYVRKAMKVSKATPREVQLGKTRVFMKSDAYMEFERCRDVASVQHRLNLQAAARAVFSDMVARRKLWKRNAIYIQAEFREYLKRSAEMREVRRKQREAMMALHAKQRKEMDAEVDAGFAEIMKDVDEEFVLLMRKRREEYMWLQEKRRRENDERLAFFEQESKARVTIMREHVHELSACRFFILPVQEENRRRVIYSQEAAEWERLSLILRVSSVDYLERKGRRLLMRIEAVSRLELEERRKMFPQFDHSLHLEVRLFAETLTDVKRNAVLAAQRRSHREAVRMERHEIESFAHRHGVDPHLSDKDMVGFDAARRVHADPSYSRTGETIHKLTAFASIEPWRGVQNVPDIDQCLSGMVDPEVDRKKVQRSDRHQQCRDASRKFLEVEHIRGLDASGNPSNVSPWRGRTGGPHSPGSGQGGSPASGGGASPVSGGGQHSPDGGHGGGGGRRDKAAELKMAGIFEKFSSRDDESRFVRMRQVLVNDYRMLAREEPTVAKRLHMSELTIPDKRAFYISMDKLQQEIQRVCMQIVPELRKLNQSCVANQVQEQNHVTGMWKRFTPVDKSLVAEYPLCTDWKKLVEERKRVRYAEENYRTELLKVILGCVDRGATLPPNRPVSSTSSLREVRACYVELVGHFAACSRCMCPMAAKSTLVQLRLKWPRMQNRTLQDRCRECSVDAFAELLNPTSPTGSAYAASPDRAVSAPGSKAVQQAAAAAAATPGSNTSFNNSNTPASQVRRSGSGAEGAAAAVASGDHDGDSRGESRN